MNQKDFFIDELLYQAKKFLKSNESLGEPEQTYWVDHNGNLHKVPGDMVFDPRGDTLRFKKGR